MTQPPSPPPQPPRGDHSVLHTVQAKTGKAPRVLLRDRASGDDRSPVVNARVGALYALPAGRDNYRILGELARGGMGVVLKAHDTELGRDVAVKVLHEDLAKRPESLHRFVEEAQIGGQLQHPGIVPVYEMGLMAEDVPYFTMKLVKGRTLAALLADRENVRSDRRRLLDIFASVCQTMAYAHSRGVIHRDLKPANVMVGAFGEVQVVDWGLAKVLRSGGAVDERRAREARASISIIETVRSDGSGSGTDSLVGSVMGTPAYMPPEQATGDLEKLDERADVFSLGAVLCEILTGSPPYTGESERTLLEAAYARQEAAQARLDACDADPDLVELVRQCLKPSPAIRPRNAEVLSERIRQHLTGLEERAHQAQIEAAEARIRAADERRARKLTLGLAASVLVIVLGAGGGWLWLGEQRHARELETAERVERALDEADLAQAQGDWVEAGAAAERAQALATSGRATSGLLRRVASVIGNIEAGAAASRLREERERDNERLRNALLEVRRGTAGDQLGGHAADPAVAYGRIFADHALAVDEGTVEEAAAALEARGLGTELALALDQWTDARRRAGDETGALRLIELAHLVDPDPVRADLREAIANQDTDALDWLAASNLRDQPASTLQLLGSALERLGQRATALEVLREAVQLYPGTLPLQTELARLLARGSEEEQQEALGAYGAALALRPSGVELRRQLAGLLLDLDRLDAAGRVLAAAVTIAPQDGDLQFLLGSSLRRRGQMEAAEAAFRRAASLERGRSVEADALLALGKMYRRGGDLERAEEALRRAIEVVPRAEVLHVELASVLRLLGRYEEAAAVSRTTIELAPGDAWNHVDLAVSLTELGDEEGAAASYRTAIRLDPRNAAAQNNLGSRLENLGKPEEALVHFARAVELDPELAVAHNNLGRLLAWKGRFDEAVTHHQRALELEPDFATAFEDLGQTLLDRGDETGALAALREAAARAPTAARLNRLAWQLATSPIESLVDGEEAVRLAEQAVALRSSGSYLGTLGTALYRRGDHARAIEVLEQALAADEDALAWEGFFLAMSHSRLGDEAEAHAWLATSIEWMDANAPDDPELLRFRSEAQDLLGP